jgi:hypothetical protein
MVLVAMILGNSNCPWYGFFLPNGTKNLSVRTSAPDLTQLADEFHINYL